MFMVVLFFGMVFVLVCMRKRAVCLVFVSMGGAVAIMNMIMLVLESMGMTVVVMVQVTMFFRVVFVTMLMIMIMLVSMNVFVGVFTLAHGMPLLLLWLLSLQLLSGIDMHP